MHDDGLDEPLARYRELADSLRDAVFLLDANGHMCFGNERFATVVDRTCDELRGRHYTDLDEFVAESSIPDFRAAVARVLDGDVAEQRVELQAHTPTEGDLIVEARITPLASDDHDGAVVSLRDVTDAVETRRALDRKTEQLAVVNAVLRHDIRNDMNIVIGWTDQLADSVDDPDTAAILDRISRHSAHVVELTYAARDLVDAIDQDWQMDVRPVSLTDAIHRELDVARDQFPHAQFVTPDDLPAIDVRANEFLGSVIGNILSNAVRHSDRDTPHVDLDVTTTDDTATVTIADNGPGIPDRIRDTVYEMGVTGDHAKHTGLGLYLVKSLMDAYDGTVEITANEPRGTKIELEFQRA